MLTNGILETTKSPKAKRNRHLKFRFKANRHFLRQPVHLEMNFRPNSECQSININENTLNTLMAQYSALQFP